MKHCYAKNDAKIDFCKFFEFCIFYSHNWETIRFRRQLTNKCSQELYFVLKQLCIISQTYENTVKR
jgi:hypothetical protein